MKRARILLAAALGLFLPGCDLPLVAGGSSSTETGKKVLVVGRVAGGTGEGIPGVIVTLEGTSLADTTGPSGEYRVSGRARLDTGGAVLAFALQGQILARKAIVELRDSLPELRFVQRGFSGNLWTNGAVVTRIAGIVTRGASPGDSVEATFHHNVGAGNYSGFVYFPVDDTVHAYGVHVNFEGAGGVLLGRSAEVPFNSLAGNIVIPDVVLDNGSSPAP